MMGDRVVAHEPLFYEFSLERHVPTDHLLLSIDQLVDLSGLREQLRPFYSETRRPSVDPELLIRVRSSATRMIERVQDDFGIWPRKLIGGTGYGSAEMLACWFTNVLVC